MSYQQAEELVSGFNVFLEKVEPLTERFHNFPAPERFDQIDAAAVPLQELIVGNLYLVADENIARIVRRSIAGLCSSVSSGTATLGAYAITHLLYAAGVALILRSDFDGVDALLREPLSPFSFSERAVSEYGNLSDIWSEKSSQLVLLEKVRKNIVSAVRNRCPAEDIEHVYSIFEVYYALEKLRAQSKRDGNFSRPVMLVAKRDSTLRFELAKLFFEPGGALRDRSVSGFVDVDAQKTAWGIVASEGRLNT